MSARTWNRRGLASWLVVGCASIVWLTGCGSGSGGGGPDVKVSPSYRPSGRLANVAGNKQAVAVAVVDARTSRGQAQGGREILAQGDKGRVYTEKPMTSVIQDATTSALQAAGFTVSPDAAVVVEMTLVDLPVQAYQFTNWGLPSERASTLDALGAVVPGPVRETRAKAELNVVIRKHDARLGFSHVASAEAANKSKDRSVLDQTLSEAISRAVDDAVAQAAPDVDVVSRTPVTAREIGGREDEILRQQKTMKAMSDELARREALLTEDRKALDEMRAQLALDQRQAQEGVAAERKALEARRKTLAEQEAQVKKDREDAQAKLEELNNKPKDTPGLDQALVTARQQQQALDTRAKELESKGKELDSKAKEIEDSSGALEKRKQALAEREQNVASYQAKLDDQSKANKSLSDDLATRQRDLEAKEKALLGWKADLEARLANRPPETLVQKRRPLILVTDPAAVRTETTLPQINVAGIAVDDRQVASLSASVNGQTIQNISTTPDAAGRGVGLRAVPAVTGGGGGGSQGSLSSRPFNFAAPLKDGVNEIAIEATNEDKLSTTQTLTVNYDRTEGRIHIIAIGINDYQNQDSVPPLRYAVADARDIAGTLQKVIATPDKQVHELLDKQATRANVVKELFDQLPTEVRPADTVIIFFSGHGAPDASTDAQGNVETFLLPIDADPTRLFTTAIRMHDVATILRRLRSDRIVFLADTCYSGAAGASVAGARTVAIPGVTLRGGVGIKAMPDRPQGKGCAVITASSGIQVAQEKDDMGHGLFTHYLLEGLQGAADADKDGKVTVDELYEYVRTQVAKSTGGKQTPQISRDPTAGEIVLSSVAK
jgi:hypothetical protein